MKKNEILFDWPIAKILHLTDSLIAEEFSENLNEVELTLFTSLTEEMRGIGEDLNLAKGNGTHYSGWAQLRQCVDSFSAHFLEFPDAEFRKFKLFVLLASKVAQTGVPLDQVVIDEHLFQIRDLSCIFSQRWFSRDNSPKFENSIAVFSCDNFVILEQEFDSSSISAAFIFQTLAALSQLGDLSVGHKAVVKKGNNNIPDATVEAFSRLMILASGKAVHEPKRYTQPLHIINMDAINPDHPYQQWNEILSVLSEYNSRDEILSKYLTIYHVFENLMFKLPIVELEQQQAGHMFSIRDFRRLYQQVDNAESVALKKLFAQILKMPSVGTTTFEQRLIVKWKALIPGVSALEIDDALRLLNIKNKHSEFKQGKDCAGYFCQIVYALRCAIVHNKETEFHLTYASLNKAFSALLEKFLLPSLEEICFAMVGSPNQHVWYSNKEILLY